VSTSGGIVEIGRKFGGSTVLLLEATDHTDREVTSIDINPSAVKSECEAVFVKNKDRLDLIDVESSQARISHGYDLLFIDGDHTYNGVKTDTESFWDGLEVGGYALYHDYDVSFDMAEVHGPKARRRYNLKSKKKKLIEGCGVKHFCDEWLAAGRAEKVEESRTMIVFKKLK
jgi:predicted O-methyltransferase YrrM